MGKTIFAAVIAALVTSIVTVMVMSSIQSEQRAADAAARKTVDDTAQVERERLDRRIAELERRAAAPRAARREAAEPPADASASGEAPTVPGAGGAPAIAPDGTPYVSQAQMEAFAKAHGVRVGEVVQQIEQAKPVEKKTLEEIAREQGLSAGEEANVRNILRESEEELVRCLFGTKTIDEIKADVLAAKDDPDKQAEMAQTCIQNALGNVGKLMTLEKRTKKRVDDVLGPERGKKFMAAPRKPVIAPELEEVLKDFGD